MNSLAFLVREFFYFYKMKLVKALPFLVLFTSAFGQNETRFNEREIVKQQRIRSENCARSLKTAVVLFRLDLKQNQIDYYRKNNNTKAADRLEQKTRKDNLAIIQAVRAKFDLCPVYFLDGKSSTAVLDGKWDSVVFLSDSLTKLSASNFQKKDNFFVAEYSYTRGQFVSSNRNNEQGKFESDPPSNELKYYENITTRVSGFIIMDSKFVPLTQPFPYYIKLMSLKKRPQVKSKIDKWNKNLKFFVAKFS